jgi:hypothetical protein
MAANTWRCRKSRWITKRHALGKPRRRDRPQLAEELLKTKLFFFQLTPPVVELLSLYGWSSNSQKDILARRRRHSASERIVRGEFGYRVDQMQSCSGGGLHALGPPALWRGHLVVLHPVFHGRKNAGIR